METKTSKSKDCEVCEKLIREKHKYDFLWKIFCVLFLATSIIFAILYFGSGTVFTEKQYEFHDSLNENTIEGDGNIVIDGEGANINGTGKEINYTPIICISIVFCTTVIIVGGIIIANHNKKDS